MIIDVTEPILTYQNKPAVDAEGNTVLVRDMIFQALNSVLASESQSADDKTKSFELSMRMFAADKVELNVSEADFVLRRSGVVNNALVHGRITEAIEGSKTVPEPEPDEG